MGRILATIKQENGDINYVAGKVTYISERDDGKVVNISMSLNCYDPETKTKEKKYISLAAWNNDDAGKSQMADRVRKAKVVAGSYILARCGTFTEDSRGPASDGTPRVNANLFDFQYNWFGEITDGEKKKSLIIGTVRTIKDNGKFFSVGIPVDKTVEKKKKTTWYNVSFADTEKSQMATVAKKILKQGSVIAVCGSTLTTKEGNNGNSFNDFYGNQLDMKYDD
jgi:hypothetical protein